MNVGQFQEVICKIRTKLENFSAKLYSKLYILQLLWLNLGNFLQIFGLSGSVLGHFLLECDYFWSIFIYYRSKLGKMFTNFCKICQSFTKTGYFLGETGQIGKIFAEIDNFSTIVG